jgi:hypothetical protein
MLRRDRMVWLNERSKEGKYGLCTFYTRMDIEFLNMLKSPQE